VKLVPALSGICGFEVIQQAKFLILVVLRKRRGYYARHGVSCNSDFVLRKWRFSHFNEKFKSHLCGNECFGVWPKHK